MSALPGALPPQFTRRLLVVFTAEQLRRVVLDLDDLLPFELLASRQVVVAGFELEVHEVGFGHEPRLGRDAGAAKVRGHTGSANGHLALPLLVFFLSLPLATFFLATKPPLFVRTPVGVRDGDALESQRTADVDAVLHEPCVLAARAMQADPSGPEDLELLLLVEDVVVEDLAVHVAPLECTLHERVEIAFRFRRFRLLRERRGDRERNSHGARERQSKGHAGPPGGRRAAGLDELRDGPVPLDDCTGERTAPPPCEVRGAGCGVLCEVRGAECCARCGVLACGMRRAPNPAMGAGEPSYVYGGVVAGRGATPSRDPRGWLGTPANGRQGKAPPATRRTD
jgi:hypothetical protein